MVESGVVTSCIRPAQNNTLRPFEPFTSPCSLCSAMLIQLSIAQATHLRCGLKRMHFANFAVQLIPSHPFDRILTKKILSCNSLASKPPSDIPTQDFSNPGRYRDLSCQPITLSMKSYPATRSRDNSTQYALDSNARQNNSGPAKQPLLCRTGAFKAFWHQQNK